MKAFFLAGFFVTLALALLAPQIAFAQGSLTPLASPNPDPALNATGQPIPNMKTLTQVEPRTPIDAQHTPGDTSNLFIISNPGSYYLTGNVTGVASKRGILVNSSNVTIDLNGFDLAGAANTFSGFYVSSTASNVTIRNGTIRNWASVGLFGYGKNLRLQGLRVSGNGQAGIFATGDDGEIVDCVTDSNYGPGIETGKNWLVRDARANSNASDGLIFNQGSLITNCSSANNSGRGIVAVAYSKISDCAVHDNAGIGIELILGSNNRAACTVIHSTVQDNNGDGIRVAGECVLLENHCNRNGGGSSAGIHATGQHNRIEGNEVSLNNNRGIKVDNDFNVIIKNMVAPAIGGIAYDLASGNKVGLIVDAPGSGAISGRSGGVSMGTTDPWANFTY